MYLLDTNIVWAFLRGSRRDLVERVLKNEGGLALCGPVVGETGAGVLLLERRGQGAAMAARWLELQLHVHVIPWSDRVSLEFARLRATWSNHGPGEMDTAIASHALAHGATLVTHDQRLLERCPGAVDWLD